MSSSAAIRRAYSQDPDPDQAIASVARSLAGEHSTLTVLYTTCDYAKVATEQAIARHFDSHQPIVGATVAGLIDPSGHYQTQGIWGFSLPADDFDVELGLLRDIQTDGVWNSRRLGTQLLQAHALQGRHCTPENSFAVLLVDGLNFCEETVVTGVASSLGSIAFCGGSAGDDLAWQRGDVLYQGEFHPNAAALLLVHSKRAFKVFSSHPFLATDRRLVVTRADPARRLVYEIDGRPALHAYAEMLNISEEQVRERSADCKTFITRIGASDFVRSVERFDKQALKFACAIDEGAVLRVAEKGDALESLKARFDSIRAHIGTIDMIWGFDCAYNRLELEGDSKMHHIAKLYQQAQLLGVCSFGEQINGLHVNQTLTGVAIACADSVS